MGSNLFGQAFEANKYLQFAILTGCMRISKESIFTSVNGLKLLPIVDVHFGTYFRFTDEEVKRFLADYQLEEHFAETKE